MHNTAISATIACKLLTFIFLSMEQRLNKIVKL